MNPQISFDKIKSMPYITINSVFLWRSENLLVKRLPTQSPYLNIIIELCSKNKLKGRSRQTSIHFGTILQKNGCMAVLEIVTEQSPPPLLKFIIFSKDISTLREGLYICNIIQPKYSHMIWRKQGDRSLPKIYNFIIFSNKFNSLKLSWKVKTLS